MQISSLKTRLRLQARQAGGRQDVQYLLPVI